MENTKKEKMKKKVYWLHSHFLFSTGGTRFVFEVVSYLKKQYEITIVVERTSDEWRKKYKKLGINIVEISPLSSNNLLYWLFFPYFLLQNFLKLKKIISRKDIIVSSMFPMNFLSIPLSRKTINYCFEPFAFFYDKDLQKSFPLFSKILLQLLSFFFSPFDKWGTLHSQKLLAINPSVGKLIEKTYKRKPDAYTYLGVDTDFFSPKIAPINPKKNKPVILFHSTDYSPLKGTDYLIKALRFLKNYDFYLLISETLANITQKKHLEKLINKYKLSKKIRFLGHLPYKKLPKYYTYADIYCFTGNPEAMGASAASLSVLEASASELSVIRSIGNKDEVIAGKTGLLVDPRDSRELAIALKKLIKNKTLRRNMGKNGRQHILKNYTWPKVAKTVSEEIEKLF